MCLLPQDSREGKIRKDFSKAFEIGGGICERTTLGDVL